MKQESKRNSQQNNKHTTNQSNVTDLSTKSISVRHATYLVAVSCRLPSATALEIKRRVYCNDLLGGVGFQVK